MANDSRATLRVRNIPTGVPKFDEEASYAEREFGIDPNDPAAPAIMQALIQLKVRYDIDVREHRELLPKVIARARYVHDAVNNSDDDPEPMAQSIVYYLRVGQLIKIGTTVSLQNRMGAYPPDAVVLATEPGSYDVERERHRQFAATKAARKEWFHPSSELIAHINKLRETPLTAVELAA